MAQIDISMLESVGSLKDVLVAVFFEFLWFVAQQGQEGTSLGVYLSVETLNERPCPKLGVKHLSTLKFRKIRTWMAKNLPCTLELGAIREETRREIPAHHVS